MRTWGIRVFVLTIAIAATITANAQTGGHTYGDCLVGGNFSSCMTHLAKMSANSGMNYLAVVNCPGCVNGDPIVGQDGSSFYPQVCPPDKKWSDPVQANLDTPNPHYSDAGPGDTGALVNGFQERICWQGGGCIAGPCESYETGDVDLNGFPTLGVRCRKTGGKIWYVIKEFGSVCQTQQYDNGSGSSGP